MPIPVAGGPEDPGGVFAALVGVHDDPGDRVLAAADRDGHRQCGVGQFSVVVGVHREPDQAPRAHVQDRVEEQLALVGDDLGPVAVPLLIHRAGREITPDQVRRAPPCLALSGGVLAQLLRPGHQVLLTHDRSDGLLTDPPARLAQIVGDPRRAVLAVPGGEDLPDRRAQLRTPRMPRRGIPVAPLVEPRRLTPSARQAVACGIPCSTPWAAMNRATATASSHPRPRGPRCA
jgi:hypothetical protein